MAKISQISARPILDSRGNWTIEVALTLNNGLRATSSVPQGKSTGTHEAKTVPVTQSLKNIGGIISPRIKGFDPSRQKAIDEILIRLDGTADKSRLGGNTMLGVSMACCRAAALVKNISLWQHIRELNGLKVTQFRGGIIFPRLFVNVINGGLHAGNNLNFQEYLIVPRAKTFRENIIIAAQMYHALGKYLSRSKGRAATNVGDEGGYAPDFKNNLEPFNMLRKIVKSLRLNKQVDFGLDAAATEIKIPQKKLFNLYRKIVRDPHFIYLEDPFGEENFAEFAVLNKTFGKKIMIAGDDLTATNVKRMGKARAANSINAMIIKPNQIGTISEALDAVRLARKFDWRVVVSHRSGETNDDFIADFAYGVGADGIKLGAPARGERTAKFNRFLEIEENNHSPQR